MAQKLERHNAPRSCYHKWRFYSIWTATDYC